MTLKEFFKINQRVALAFSGGTDSVYLLYAAKKYAQDVTAYYVKTQFQPEFELDDAKRAAEMIGAKLKIIELSVLNDADIKANGPLRCYYCKKKIFSAIIEQMTIDGYSVLIDGTNASDDASDRPGMTALKELSVESPLKICNLTKDKIRLLSKEAGLFTWDKPAYACLATRIKTGEEITDKDLKITQAAENVLAKMGFTDFRIRKDADTAKIQICENQLTKLLDSRREVLERLKKYYKSITLDMEVRNDK